MFNSLQPHGLQHVRLLYPSLSHGVCTNSCSLSWWCHPTISFSGILFSFCLQSFPSSGSFPIIKVYILASKWVILFVSKDAYVYVFRYTVEMSVYTVPSIFRFSKRFPAGTTLSLLNWHCILIPTAYFPLR